MLFRSLCTGERIEHFMQYVSLDTGIPEHAEYIRRGLDYNRLNEYVNRFLTEISGRNSLTFIITMNNLSILGLKRLLEQILILRRQHSTTYQRVWFDTPVLRKPEWQSIQLLPESYVDQLEYLWAWMIRQAETTAEPFKGFKDYEIARLDRDIAWMRSGQQLPAEYIQRNKADFYRFFTEHDRRRGTNFLNTFPEMSDWWRECEYWSRQ
mgnify:CR=1 FL=1